MLDGGGVQASTYWLMSCLSSPFVNAGLEFGPLELWALDLDLVPLFQYPDYEHAITHVLFQQLKSQMREAAEEWFEILPITLSFRAKTAPDLWEQVYVKNDLRYLYSNYCIESIHTLHTLKASTLILHSPQQSTANLQLSISTMREGQIRTCFRCSYEINQLSLPNDLQTPPHLQAGSSPDVPQQ